MKVVYSLKQSPASYDFTGFLVNAERYRIERSKGSLQIHITCGNRMLTERDHTFTEERKDFRARTLLTELSWLLPSVTAVSYSLEDEIQELHYRPNGAPVNDVKLEPSEAARGIAKMYLEDKHNPVTITVRQSDYQPERNTNLLFVRQVCEFLERNDYTPIIIPDTDNYRIHADFPDMGALVYPPAAFSADIMLALFEQSCMNIIGMQGPCTIAMMSYAPVLLLCTVDNEYELHSEAQYKRYAFTPDADWGERKHIRWCRDSDGVDGKEEVKTLFADRQYPGWSCVGNRFLAKPKIEVFA